MAITLPGVECVAAADLYDGRHTLAKEITGNTSLPTTRQYQELLDRKDIDCIVAAVPDHWHKRVVVDACNAGKDIYCEKPMSHNVARRTGDGGGAQKNNRIVQIGSQRVSSVLCAKARELYQNGRHRRCGDGRAHAGTQRSDGSLAVSAASGSVAAEPGLGYLAERCAEDSVRQLPLRALALLEGIRHGRRAAT